MKDLNNVRMFQLLYLFCYALDSLQGWLTLNIMSTYTESTYYILIKTVYVREVVPQKKSNNYIKTIFTALTK